MGDTGSLLLGLVASILAISFIEHHQIIYDTPYGNYAVKAPPAVAAGILMLPLFDTLRVFVMRMIRGQSPFKPDRNHIHHLILDLGFSHMQATAILIMVNIGFIVIVYQFQSLGTFKLLLLLLFMASFLMLVINFARKYKTVNPRIQKTV